MKKCKPAPLPRAPSPQVAEGADMPQTMGEARRLVIYLRRRVNALADLVQESRSASEIAELRDTAQDQRYAAYARECHERGLKPGSIEGFKVVCAEIDRDAIAASRRTAGGDVLEQAAKLAIKFTAVPRDLLGPPVGDVKRKAQLGETIAAAIRALKHPTPTHSSEAGDAE